MGNVGLLELQGRLLRLGEVLHGDLHPPLSESQQAGLCADGLDVGPCQSLFGVDYLINADVLRKTHFGRQNRDDFFELFLVGKRKEDFSVDSARSDQSRVQTLYSIGGHYDLDIRISIKAVQLV